MKRVLQLRREATCIILDKANGSEFNSRGGAVQDANGQSTCPDDCSVMGEIQAGHCGLITAHQIFIVLH